MQLTAFRILKYRNIEDSGLIKLADHLTCIVGKNQSGKTNLLRGLHKFNPHDKSAAILNVGHLGRSHSIFWVFSSSGGMVKVARAWRKTGQEGKIA
jgi:recombinational DNA repair ATPase RecF